MYHCYHPSDGYCILGMVIIGGAQGANAVLPKSRTQKADIFPILHWKHPVLGQFLESDNQPSIRNHYQEVSEEYCILGMMQFGSVMGILYVLTQQAPKKRTKSVPRQERVKVSVSPLRYRGIQYVLDIIITIGPGILIKLLELI